MGLRAVAQITQDNKPYLNGKRTYVLTAQPLNLEFASEIFENLAVPHPIKAEFLPNAKPTPQSMGRGGCYSGWFSVPRSEQILHGLFVNGFNAPTFAG